MIKRFIISIFTLSFILCIIGSSQVFAATTDYEDHWAKEAIEKWLQNQWATGTSTNTFKPENDISRAEVMQLIINRLNKEVEGEAVDSFADVKDPNQWYYRTAYDAKMRGYITGYLESDNTYTFRPYNPMSRQDVATVVGRIYNLSLDEDIEDEETGTAAKVSNNTKVNESTENPLSKFTDSNKVADYAKEYMSACVKEGYLKGYPGNTIRPRSNMKRAEVLKFFDTVTDILGDPDKEIELTAITVEPKTLTLEEGSEDEIKVTIEPKEATEKEIVWSSSDEEVATVDSNGKVTAISEGEATITATAKNNAEIKDTCKVEVTKPTPTPQPELTDIDIEPTTLEVTVDDTYELLIILTPDNAINPTLVWETSDESVVSVDAEGKITAIAEGNATITAKSEENESIEGTCEISVRPKITAIEITTTEQEATIATGEDVTLALSYTPDTTLQKGVSWASDNEAIATVDNAGKVTGVSEGTAVITVTSETNPEISDQITVTINAAVAES